MGRNWAITIGINGYRNLQRLNYAQQDAEAMRQLFSQELDFQHVYHFTDDSPPIPQDYGSPLDSQPTYTTLRRFLRTRFEQPFLRDGDNLWFFFAGHGIRDQNRDYLMPMDGDRGDLDNSAIPINYISERLRQSGADNIILLIDACRSLEGRRDGLGRHWSRKAAGGDYPVLLQPRRIGLRNSRIAARHLYPCVVRKPALARRR